MFAPVNQRTLSASICFGLICGMGFFISAHAQIFAQGAIGYINQVFYSGDNLIANQFSNSNNTLNVIFNQGIPEGTAFTKWNPATVQFLPISTYDTNGGWSINYGLGYGEGGLLHSASTFTNIFFGTVWPGYNGPGSFVPPLVTSYGLLLLSCYAPIGSATFYDVVGRNPQNGESVALLNAAAQLSTITTFANGNWSNGNPLLNVGQSAFFTLKPVPEPEVLSLCGAGAIFFATFCRKGRR
jgi:hypothetical protein